MKLQLLPVIIAILLLPSCTSDDAAEPVPPVAPLLHKSSTMTMSGIPDVCEYFYDGNKLTMVSCTTGQRVFTYEEDRIVQIDVTFEGSSWTEYFDYDSQGRVHIHRQIGEAYGSKHVYHYTGNISAMVDQFTGGVTIQETFVGTGALEFDPSGEVLSCKFEGTTTEYSYDNQHCATKNITGYGPMSSLLSYNLMGTQRNPSQFTRRTAWGINSYEKYIEYNELGYPTQISVSDPLDGETLSITYEYYP